MFEKDNAAYIYIYIYIYKSCIFFAMNMSTYNSEKRCDWALKSLEYVYHKKMYKI